MTFVYIKGFKQYLKINRKLWKAFKRENDIISPILHMGTLGQKQVKYLAQANTASKLQKWSGFRECEFNHHEIHRYTDTETSLHQCKTSIKRRIGSNQLISLSSQFL